MVNHSTINPSQVARRVGRNVSHKADPALGDNVPVWERRTPDFAKLRGTSVVGRSGPGAETVHRPPGSAPDLCVRPCGGVFVAQPNNPCSSAFRLRLASAMVCSPAANSNKPTLSDIATMHF